MHSFIYLLEGFLAFISVSQYTSIYWTGVFCIHLSPPLSPASIIRILCIRVSGQNIRLYQRDSLHSFLLASTPVSTRRILCIHFSQPVTPVFPGWILCFHFCPQVNRSLLEGYFAFISASPVSTGGYFAFVCQPVTSASPRGVLCIESNQLASV